MSGQELIQALRESGTGEGKLAAGAVAMERKRDASAHDVFAEMAAAGVGPVTLEKAKRLMRGEAADPAPYVPPSNWRPHGETPVAGITWTDRSQGKGKGSK